MAVQDNLADVDAHLLDLQQLALLKTIERPEIEGQHFVRADGGKLALEGSDPGQQTFLEPGVWQVNEQAASAIDGSQGAALIDRPQILVADYANMQFLRACLEQERHKARLPGDFNSYRAVAFACDEVANCGDFLDGQTKETAVGNSGVWAGRLTREIPPWTETKAWP